MKIQYFKHNIGLKEMTAVGNVLKSIILTTGPVTREFEEKFSEYLNCRYAIAVTSCTAALFLSLKAYDIGAGDDVITTPMTFIATPNSIIHAGANPVFIDVEKDTGNMDAKLVEKAITSRTKAIMPVHLYGQMCDMKSIKEIADKHGLIVIEDAAHAVEANRDEIRVGQAGNIACFSFYATKNLTCGEGGAICTNNEEIYEKIKKMRLHGMSKGAAERYSRTYEHWDMEMLGWKYNMDDIHAALLLNQLRHLERYYQRREEICRIYEEAFGGIEDLDLLRIVKGAKSARHLFTILVPPKRRDEIVLKLQEKGIGVAVNFRAVHLLKYYRDTFGYKRGMFPVAEDIGDRTITIPLYPKLSDQEVKYIIRAIREILAPKGAHG